MGRRAYPVLVLAMLGAGGCVEADESGETLVLRFAYWVLLLPLLGAAVMTALGVVAVKSGASVRKIVIPFALAAAAVGLFLPSMATDRVVVGSTEIRQTTGLWFARRPKGFRYADVHSVRIEQRTSKKGLPNDVWVVRYKTGGVEDLDPGDLWEKGSDRIIPRLREHGVDVK